MAKPVAQITLGIDVAKDQLTIYHWQQEHCETLANESRDIQAYLARIGDPIRLAVEPTSHYHLSLIEAALAQGCEIYLVNPRQLVHYRLAIGGRNKTDPQDAWLLARYLEHEAAQLKPFQPQSRQAQRLWMLLKRRALVVKSRQQIELGFRELSVSVRALVRQFNQLLQRLDRQIQSLIKELGWWQDYLRCQSVPGIGAISAAALTVLYHRGAFSGSDAFIAFLGLDIRLRESGYYRGQAKLTKQGPSEVRRLLYCASHQARRYPPYRNYFDRMVERGYSKIAARVSLARKLARVAFTLMRKQESFKPVT